MELYEKDEAYYEDLWRQLNNYRLHPQMRKAIIQELKDEGRYGSWHEEE